ncbi:uncharacterized protein LOC120130622 [Hibiscus syriacus]|uniref:uncharacterized protein LOC120130622 n=1 Tax=Hibiscus syriacus TaxID=106335 RepID=UPI001921208D|nr:uncharacterized protein LOC120130622 [Hibiscus syriacus]
MAKFQVISTGSVDFGKENSEDEALSLKIVLCEYEVISGQKVNLDKSLIFLARRPKVCHKQSISSILGVQEGTDPGLYLGFPLIIEKNKTNAFGFLRDKVIKHTGVGLKLVIFWGREIFLKAVTQALLTYAMTFFLIPDGIINSIISDMQRIWWTRKNRNGWTHVA